MNKQILLFIFFPIIALSSPKKLNYQELPTSIQHDLIQRFPSIKNNELTLRQLDEIIRFLSYINDIENVQIIEDDTAEYKIEFNRTKKILDIQFSGNKEFSKSELLKTLPFSINSKFDITEAQQSISIIMNQYTEIGYLNPRVDLTYEEKENGIDIHYLIKENQVCKIQSIQIIGNNRNLNEKIKDRVAGSINDSCTEINFIKIRSQISTYLKENYFVRAEVIGPQLKYAPHREYAELQFQIDKPEKYIFKFNGAININSGEIYDSIDLKNFFSASPNIAPEIAARIKNLYLSKGYAKVDIQTYEAETSQAFQKNIDIKINEGHRIIIEKIDISGKTSRPFEYYAHFIINNSSKLIKKNYYNKDDIDLGVKNLITELRNQGYFQTRILSIRSIYNKDKTKISIVINIDEGPLTSISNIQLEGVSDIYKNSLNSIIGFNPQEPLKLFKLEAAINNIKNFYKNLGYIEMFIVNENDDLVKYNSDYTIAELNFKIFEGPKVSVHSIIVEGNHFTKDYVILNEVGIQIGDILTPTKMEEATLRLQKTGYFNTAEIKTLEEKTNTSERTLHIRVTERQPGLFTFGPGVTNERRLTLRGYLGLSYNNIYGTGRGTSLRFEGNYNVSEVKYPESKTIFSYIEPYFFDQRIRGRANLSRSQIVTDYEIGQVTETNQFTGSFEKELNKHVNIVLEALNLATLKDFGIDERYPYEQKILNIGTFGPTISFDYRDNLFHPTRGTYSTLSAEYATPNWWSSETITFYKVTAAFTHYASLAEIKSFPLVWANQFRVGYLENLNTSPAGGVPYDKKGFTLGGQSTIRGFESGTSDVFPNKVDLGSDKFLLKTNAKEGLFKSELRIPIFGDVSTAVFYDGGYIEIAGLQFLDYYRDSMGIGFQYNTPLGPLNLEWAWKLDRRKNEEAVRFHLSMGSF